MFKLREDSYQVQTRNILLDNSITVKVGDLIIPVSGSPFVTNATNVIAGDFYPLGLVVGFCGPNAEVVGQGQNPALTPNQLTTTATNKTVEKYGVQYIPITEEMELLGTLSAVAGTTTPGGSSSAYPFTWFNLSDCRTINEASVALYASTALQIFSYGLDPLDTTNFTVICRLRKNSLEKAV
jgi:hypothetical protein